MNLYPRYIEPTLKAALADTPVVCVLGPRQAGKTTLVQRLAPKRTYLSFDDPNMLNAASYDLLGFVQGLPAKVILQALLSDNIRTQISASGGQRWNRTTDTRIFNPFG